MSDDNMQPQEPIVTLDTLVLERKESAVLEEAVAAYHASRDPLSRGDSGSTDEAWGKLANQVVGRENF